MMVMWPVMRVASVTACMRHEGEFKLLCWPRLQDSTAHTSQNTVPWGLLRPALTGLRWPPEIFAVT